MVQKIGLKDGTFCEREMRTSQCREGEGNRKEMGERERRGLERKWRMNERERGSRLCVGWDSSQECSSEA